MAITYRQRLFPTCYGTELISMAVLKWCQETGIDWHYIAPADRQIVLAEALREMGVKFSVFGAELLRGATPLGLLP